MMMIEKNNQAIAAVMVDWLEAGSPTAATRAAVRP